MTTFGKLVPVLGLLLCSAPVDASDCANDIPPSKPDTAFVLHDNGTATDTQTGLMWQRCSAGQSLRDSGCAGEASIHTWPEALALAASNRQADYDDWRLPNVRELRSLLEHCRVEPAINIRVFPDTPSLEFWSASPTVDVAGSAWYVDFNFGMSYGTGGLVAPYRVRLVRDPLPSDSSDAPADPVAADEQPDPAKADSPSSPKTRSEQPEQEQ